MAFLGVQPGAGIEILMDLLGFRQELAGARLVITGEGSLDAQSLHGKAPVGVTGAAGTQGVPVVAVAGRTQLSVEQLRGAGIQARRPAPLRSRRWIPARAADGPSRPGRRSAGRRPAGRDR
ncbi:glycerate kinase [Streptomyces shenzhenensis]|uniref:glycerate kinase n=1 Tax=Streptomyces shenzhenensis TaxID=943815 RepID=UPI0033E1EC51